MESKTISNMSSVKLPETFVKKYNAIIEEVLFENKYRKKSEQVPEDWQPRVFPKILIKNPCGEIALWHHSDINPLDLKSPDKRFGFINCANWDTVPGSYTSPSLGMGILFTDGCSSDWSFYNIEQIKDFFNTVKLYNPSEEKSKLSAQLAHIPLEVYVSKYDQGFGDTGILVGIGYNSYLHELVKKNR